VSLDGLLLYSFIIFSPPEKADSDVTVDAGMTNISLAIRASIGYVAEDIFQ
jgi:hypothetical protein